MPQTSTPKRKQVRLACTSCRKSKTGCDEQRPCRRCVARGKADTCSDAPKKRRTVTKKMKSTNKTKDCTTINNKKDISKHTPHFHLQSSLSKAKSIENFLSQLIECDERQLNTLIPPVSNDFTQSSSLELPFRVVSEEPDVDLFGGSNFDFKSSLSREALDILRNQSPSIGALIKSLVDDNKESDIQYGEQSCTTPKQNCIHA
mmetsp:Transcript_23399/g.39986  ORF Transcript_23399/g.39986 Transcript_23399/m.39986 type:complete len:203 (+) Transcript_23399:49-657(+)